VCEGAAGAETCTCTPGFAGVSCEDATWMVPAVPTTQLDLLLVVDNSAAMAVEQQQLAAAAPALLAALITHVGRLPDLHVGVVTLQRRRGRCPRRARLPAARRRRRAGRAGPVLDRTLRRRDRRLRARRGRRQRRPGPQLRR
jgi:hypothetical protein